MFNFFRDSVQEITACLHAYKPLIKVMEFVGQAGTKGKKGQMIFCTNTTRSNNSFWWFYSKYHQISHLVALFTGLTQKEQIEVVKRFREGGFNTLVATCVGEEGLQCD